MTEWTNWPWIVDKTESGKNWTICTVGTSNIDGCTYEVTTDHVHASELEGDAKFDAHLIAAAPELYEAVLHLSEHPLSFGCIGCQKATLALKKARGE